MVHVIVAPEQPICPAWILLITGGADAGESITRRLKLVFHPLLLAMVTGEHTSVQFVGIVSN